MTHRILRCLMVAIAGVGPYGPAGVVAQERSLIVELPIRIPLAPWLAEIERLVPQEMRLDEAWQDYKGVKVWYAARGRRTRLTALGQSGADSDLSRGDQREGPP